jgi:hypothetical protein
MLMNVSALIMRDERAGQAVGVTSLKGRSGYLPEPETIPDGNRVRNAVPVLPAGEWLAARSIFRGEKMKNAHPYTADCQCFRCKGIRNRPQQSIKLRKPKERTATSEEQHARYIDCGPQNWDDR